MSYRTSALTFDNNSFGKMDFYFILELPKYFQNQYNKSVAVTTSTLTRSIDRLSLVTVT